jgi:hypothetical protein
MEEVSSESEKLDLYTNSTLTLTPMPVSSVISVSGPSGNELFRIKPDGEFVPGPGISESEAISEAARTFYKNMTIFGKSFSETLASKEDRIKELEKQLEELKNGSQY